MGARPFDSLPPDQFTIFDRLPSSAGIDVLLRDPELFAFLIVGADFFRLNQ